MRSVASVKDLLKNKSRENGKTLQELYTLYGIERTILPCKRNNREFIGHCKL